MVLVQEYSSNWSQDIDYGYSHLKARLRLESVLTRWLIPMAIGKRSQFLAGYWQGVSVPCHIDLSIELLESHHDLVAGFPQPSDPRKKSKKKTTMSFMF